MKPSILFILHLPPPTHGASMVGKYIQESALLKERFDAGFINLTTSRNLNGTPNNKWSKALAFFNIQKNVFNALSKRKYDLCYVTLNAKGPSFYKDLMVVSVLKLFGKKVIYHFHNKGVASWSKWGVNRFFYRFAFKGARSILLSELLYADIDRYAAREDVFFCPNGIPEIANGVTDIPMTVIQKEATGVCRLLFLSNMIAEKGVYVLLDACRILKERGLRFECHFVGAWSDVSEADFDGKVDEYGLRGLVTAHGKKYGQEKMDLYDKADVFVFPTFYHNECFPLVILEAMQCSLPVISTTEGGIPDIILDNTTGLLVPRHDPVALADNIGFLIEQPEIRQAMGASGRKRFEQLFTLEKFEHQLSSILEKAILS